MRNDKVVYTPEKVAITYDTAGIGSRFLALAIDTGIQIIAAGTGFLMLLFAGADYMNAHSGIFSWYTAAMILILFLFLSGYFIILEWLMGGRTPGKAAMKIRVIKTNGAPVDLFSCIIRNIFRIADMLPSFYLAGILVMFISSESRRIGDFAAGTLVVKDNINRLSRIDAVDKADYGEVDYGEIQKGIFPLAPDEFAEVKDFLRRRSMLVKPARAKVASLMAEKYWNKFHISQEDRSAPEEFLERIYNNNR